MAGSTYRLPGRRLLSVVVAGALALGVLAGSVMPASAATPGVEYRGHVQSIGWQGWVSNGATAGTSGRSLRVEALQLRLRDVDGAISCQAHVQSKGWMNAVSGGNSCGTSGQSLRIEAIKLTLTGPAKDRYDLYYRGHVQFSGWLDWAKNGQSSGSAGLSRRVEAVEVRLVPKGEAAPGSTARPFVDNNTVPAIQYRAHVQTFGWVDKAGNPVSVPGGQVSNKWVSTANGVPAWAGSTGLAKRVEAFELRGVGGVTGEIECRAHVQGIGWMDWANASAPPPSNASKTNPGCGTTGQARRVEAIQLRLTGAAATTYDLYYRGHVQSFGWLDWAANGQSAGSEGLSKRVEAVEVRLVAKGGKAPGATSRPFVVVPLDGGSGINTTPGRRVFAQFVGSVRDAKKPVTLQGSRDGGKSWVSQGTSTMNSSGRVEFSVLPEDGVTYRAVAAARNSAGKIATPTRSIAAVWNQAFSDDFNGSALDRNKWNYRLEGSFGAKGRECSAPFASNVSVTGGALNLSVRKADAALAAARKAATQHSTDLNVRGCPNGVYTNAMVGTQNLFTMNHGIVAAKVRLTVGQGLHDSIWLQSPGKQEIDFVEGYGYGSGVTSVVHMGGVQYPSSTDPKVRPIDGLTKDRSWWDRDHIFAVQWNRNEFIFYVDGVETNRVKHDNAAADYFLVVSALSSDWETARMRTPQQRNTTPGIPAQPTVLPQTTKVDWIRAWTQK